jgi:c-di-GMP-binding flagellar brake protein YcgR
VSFQHLLDKLKSRFSNSHDQVDRRAYQRVQLRMPVMLRTAFEKKARAATVIEVGLGGVRLETTTEFREWEHVELTVPSVAMKGAGLPLEAVWRRKRKGAEGYWAGLRFLLETPEQEQAVVQFLLDDCQLGVLQLQERRRYVRVPMPLELDGRLFVKEGPRLTVKVRDLSLGGALLVAPESVAVESQAAVRIPLLADQPPFDGVGVVVRETERDGGFELGLNFDKLDAAHALALKKFLSHVLASPSSGEAGSTR